MIHNLVNEGKKVYVIYATSGDGAGKGSQREQESITALNVVTVDERNIHFLRIPERNVLNDIKGIVTQSIDIVTDLGTYSNQ